MINNKLPFDNRAFSSEDLVRISATPNKLIEIKNVDIIRNGYFGQGVNVNISGLRFKEGFKYPLFRNFDPTQLIGTIALKRGDDNLNDLFGTIETTYSCLNMKPSVQILINDDTKIKTDTITRAEIVSVSLLDPQKARKVEVRPLIEYLTPDNV